MMAARATAAEGDVLRRRAARWRRSRGPRPSSSGWSSAHCSTCMPPSEPPIARERPLDAEVREQARGARVTRSRTVQSGKRRPYGSPVAGIDRATGRSCPGSRRAGSRRRRSSRSVSSGLPGPIRLSHQPGARRVAVVAGGVRVAGQRVADEDAVGRGRRRARRRSRRRPRPEPACAPDSSTSGSRSSKSDDPLRLDQAERARLGGGSPASATLRP